MWDFVLPERPVDLQLVAGRGHYEAVVQAVQGACTSVWIATANLKELMVEDPGLPPWQERRQRRRRGASGFRSVLEVFDRLAEQQVELRLLHAKLPSEAFRRAFDRHPRLIQGGLELRQCPRVHLKTVVVDGTMLYLGSANWTGAGLGAKASGRRNLELGILTRDEQLLDTVQELFDGVWQGGACGDCRLRARCEAPLDLESARIAKQGGG